MADTILDWVTRWWDFIDSRQIVRRLVLFLTLWMTWKSFEWAAAYAAITKMDGLGTGAVIAAVTAPVAALQGYVFKIYAEGRG